MSDWYIKCFVAEEEEEDEQVVYIPVGTKCAFEEDLYQYYLIFRRDIDHPITNLTCSDLQSVSIELDWHNVDEKLEYKTSCDIHFMDIVKLACDDSLIKEYNDWHFPEEPIPDNELGIEYYILEDLRTWIISGIQNYAKWCMKNNKTKECKIQMRELEKIPIALPCVKDEISHALSVM